MIPFVHKLQSIVTYLTREAKYQLKMNTIMGQLQAKQQATPYFFLVIFFLFRLSCLLGQPSSVCLPNPVTDTTTTTDTNSRQVSNQLFSLIRQHSIYREKANWKALQVGFELYQDTARNPFTAFRWLFKQLGDFHSSVRYQNKTYRNPIPRPAHKAKAYNYLLGKESYNQVEVQLLQNQYGYLLVPTVTGDEKKTGEFIIAFRDSLCRKIPLQVKGWIIDLRTNGGGNTFPMVAVLDFLLPEGVFARVQGPSGEILEEWSLQEGNAYIDQEKVTVNGASCRKKDLSTPVVLLTSPMTVSAGEMVRVAFAARSNMIQIGDTTGGLVTSNEWIEINAHTALNISNGYVADQKGHLYTKAIIPHVVLPKGYHLEDLSKDQHVQAAIAWLRSRKK